MTTANFTPTERILLVSAPQLIRHLLTAADRSAVFTQLGEAKALKDFLSSHRSQSPVVQAIIAGQKDVDEKMRVSTEEAQKMLEQVGIMLEAKTDEAEGDVVRGFLMGVAEAVAKAVREQGSTATPGVSPTEERALAVIATALKATESDKRRRHTAAMNAAAMKQVEEQQAKAKAEAEARKKAEEAKSVDQQKAEQARRLEEAKKKAELARQQREESARQHAEQAAQQGSEAQQKAEQARRLEEAKKKAEQARLQREESARRQAEKAEQGKVLSAAEALQQKAEAMKREAEAIERQAEAMKAAAQGTAEAADTVYVVKPGDTLSGIAKAVYGKAGRWREIFEANRDIINNPNLIRPGWKLRIPR